MSGSPLVSALASSSLRWIASFSAFFPFLGLAAAEDGSTETGPPSCSQGLLGDWNDACLFGPGIRAALQHTEDWVSGLSFRQKIRQATCQQALDLATKSGASSLVLEIFNPLQTVLYVQKCLHLD